MKIFITIIFNISLLFGIEPVIIPKIPSSSEISKPLSSLKGGCEQCLDEGTSQYQKYFFDKFDCPISQQAEKDFKKAALAAGLTEKKYEEMKLPDEDRVFSKEEIDELAILLKSEEGIFISCALPKALKAHRENVNGFKLCECNNRTTGFVYCPKDKATAFYLKDNESMAIDLWTSSTYWKINEALRSKNKDTVCEMAPLAIELMQGLAKTPSYSGVVYRGTGMPKDFEDQHQVGKIVEYSGLTSTSLDKKTAKHFAGVKGWLLKINLKSACHDIQFSSQGESEILCPPGIHFKVIQRDDAAREMILEEVTFL